jgi:transcription initiation factor TFIIE subunit alpha
VDVKPNVQLLDSLGDYRKRARSPSAHEDEPPAKKFSQDSGPAPTATPAGEPEVAQESEDDPTVYGRSLFSLFRYLCLRLVTVNGEAMPYSAVTEEHHDLMTPDEYTAYFEIASTRM